MLRFTQSFIKLDGSSLNELKSQRANIMYRRIPQFTLFLLILQAILLYLHWFVYQTIIVLLNIESPTAILILRAVFLFLSFSLMVSSLLVWRYVNVFVSALYRFAMVWMGFFFYFFIASFFAWVGFDFIPPFDARVLVITLFALAFIVSVYGIENAKKVRVTTLTIALPHLPGAWKKRSAVFVSDTHLGQIRGAKFAQHVVAIIRNLHPDIVLIGGDVYDGVATDVAKVTEPFSRLRPPLGVYYVTGNHDEFRNVEEYIRALKGAGVHVLMNQMVMIDGLQLVGVDYRDTELKKPYREVMAGIKIDPRKPSILLRHVPNFIKVAKEAGVSLQLSGHTHYGQVFPLMLLTSWIFKGYGYGLKAKGNTQVYTSSGVGTWGPPLRIGTKAEIVKMTFTNATR